MGARGYAAKSTDGRTIAANIIGVTNGDENCDSYQACLDALKSGKTIAYVGKTGNLAFNAAGEPSVGSYGVLEFDGDNKLLTPTRKYVSVAAQ